MPDDRVCGVSLDRTLEPLLNIGRLFGIRIGLSASWFIIFALVAWTLAAGYFPAQHLGWSARSLWALGILGSLLFFCSVLIHELAHSLVALHYGISVTRITLFIFGGAAHIDRDAPSPRVEATISAAGPAASFALMVLFGALSFAGREASQSLSSLCFWLAVVNGSLAIFNLIPGFPLDGGRLLRAMLWFITDDYRAATRVATLAGQATGLLLAFYGFSVAFGREGMLMAGLWPALVGLFLYSAAQSSWRAFKLATCLEQVVVEDVMDRDVAAVPAGSSVEEFVNEYLMRKRHRRFPVVDGDRLLGTVGLEEVRRVAPGLRSGTGLRPLLRTVDEQPPVDAKERGDRALAMLSEQGAEELPVVEGGRLVGVVRREDLLRLAQTRGILRR